MKDIDACLDSFLKYKETFEDLKKSDLTESDTRSKIIDKFFFEVLDWDEVCVKREGYVIEGFYDYLFTIPSFKFVVEAKKTFVHFEIPAQHNSVSIGTFERSNKDIVSQVRKYLYEIGIQHAVITNGYQFIIGKFSNTDGTDWRKNKCLIFNGFDDIISRFTSFYNILSKNSIVDNSGFKIHLEESFLKRGQNILPTLPAKDLEIVRNSISSELTPLIDQLFGELYSLDDSVNNQLIEECFVENKEIKKNRSEIEKLFADLPPAVENIVLARNTSSIVNQIENEILQDELKYNITPPNPIVIVGSKGAGKTTFINYLFKNTGETVEKSHPYIYVDFRKYTGVKDNFQNDIFIDILDQIYEKYNEVDLSTYKALNSIYNKEIRRNNEGIWKYDKDNDEKSYEAKLSAFFDEKIKNAETHFFRLSEHLIRSRRTRLCIVIDNADQFDSDTQAKVFLFAQSLHKKGNVTIILSLREGYYYKWRYLPPFDAFPCNVYHITAPPYKEVLQKRIDYALEQMELAGKSRGVAGKNKTLILNNDTVRKFLLSLKASLFGEENSKLLSFIQETTYPNIRDGLSIFKRFLVSGHTEVHQYILRQEANPESTKVIPFWEFIKAVGLENKKYYNHNISIINNLFYPVEGHTNHFLKIKILGVLDDKLRIGGSTEKYYNAGSLIDILVESGYIYKHVRAELDELCKLRLVETDDQMSDIEGVDLISTDDSVCISMKGHHYINTLIYNFAYIEMTLEDTPIFDEKYFSEIKKLHPQANELGKKDLRRRVAVAEKFIEYLENKEKFEAIENQAYIKDIVTSIKTRCQDDIDRIRRVISNASYN